MRQWKPNEERMKLISSHRGRFSTGVLIGIFSLVAMMLSIQSAIAQTCVKEHAGKSLICSGSDVRVIFADNIRNVSGDPMTECVNGKSFSFIADLHVQTTAKARYDIGLYFATDGDPYGDGATSGMCSGHIIQDRHLDPAFPNAVMLGAAVAANLDDDACRDISADYGWRRIGGRVVTVRVDNVLCHDSDRDGRINLPYCTSWSQTPGGVCNSPDNAAPSSAAHCNCDISFNVPIFVNSDTIPVTKDFNPDPAADGGSDLSLLSEPEIRRESHP
jgi:hypothetical protein